MTRAKPPSNARRTDHDIEQQDDGIAMLLGAATNQPPSSTVGKGRSSKMSRKRQVRERSLDSGDDSEGSEEYDSSDLPPARLTTVTPKTKKKKKVKTSSNKKKRAQPVLDLRLMANSDDYLSKMTNNPNSLKKIIKGMANQMEHERDTQAMKDHMSRPGAMRYHTKRNNGVTQPQVQECVNMFANGLYSTQKFLAENWDQWSSDKYSTCHALIHMLVKAKVSRPPGMSWPDYWTTKLRYLVSYKMGQIMNAKLQKMRASCKALIEDDLEEHILSPEELTRMIKNAPIKNLESDEWSKFVFEKGAMDKLVNWIVLVPLSQVGTKEMLSALITDKNEWKLSKLVNDTDLAMAAFQFVGNWEKYLETFKPSDNETTANNETTAKRNNAPGKFCRSEGKGAFESGFTEEGMEFYHDALEFFKALSAHKEFFAVETNVKVFWMESPKYKSQRERAESMKNKQARKTKPDVHPEDIPVVNEAFAKMIYGSDDEGGCSNDGNSDGESEEDDEQEYDDDSDNSSEGSLID